MDTVGDRNIYRDSWRMHKYSGQKFQKQDLIQSKKK